MRLSRTGSLFLAALLYAAGLAVVSLSPLTDWRFIPQAPWEFLWGPWPRYWTGFDVLVNIIAYTPLGVFVSRAISLHRRHTVWGPLQAFFLALVCGICLSIVLEGLQTYLPSRRPSILDVTANGLGTFVGAFLASAYAQGSHRLQITETRPIEIGGLMLLGLWFIAQAAPQPIWLALGDVTVGGSLGEHLPWFAAPPDPSAADVELFAAQRILVEALCVATAIMGCALLAHLTLLESPRWWPGYGPGHWVKTFILIVVLTLGIRAIWVLLLLGPGALVTWLNAGTQAGIVLTLLSAYGFAGARPSQQRIVAILSLLITVFLANSLPENGYTATSYLAWSQGKWLNLQMLANAAAAAWPFAALGWFWLVISRRSVRGLDRELNRSEAEQ
jgi:VanZ family protein